MGTLSLVGMLLASIVFPPATTIVAYETGVISALIN